jgi:outer membrane protein assembly factor BamB
MYEGDGRKRPILRRRSVLKTAGVGIASLAGLGRVETVQADPGDEKWSLETEEYVLHMPTVVDGTAYVVSSENGVVGTLHAVDAATGERQWSFETEDAIENSPMVVDGSVYFDSDKRYVLNATTGEQQRGVLGRLGPDSQMSLIDGTIYFTGAYIEDSHSNNNKEPLRGLHAASAATGEQQWSFEIEASSLPVVAYDTVYITSGGWEGVPGGYDDAGTLHAVDAISGRQQWTTTIDNEPEGTPTAAEGNVFFTSEDLGDVGSEDESTKRYGGDDTSMLHAVDAATGDQHWTFKTNDTSLSSPTVADGTVYVGSYDTGEDGQAGNGDDAGTLYAVDAETGSEQWSIQKCSVIYHPPTVADGTVYFCCENFGDDGRDGTDDDTYVLHAVDAATGDQQWMARLENTVTSSPIIANGTLYVSSTGGVHAFETAVSGSSEDSRVMLGTFGHHGNWRYAGQNIDVQPADSNNSSILGGSLGTPAMLAVGGSGGGLALLAGYYGLVRRRRSDDTADEDSE